MWVREGNKLEMWGSRMYNRFPLWRFPLTTDYKQIPHYKNSFIWSQWFIQFLLNVYFILVTGGTKMNNPTVAGLNTYRLGRRTDM